MIALLLSLALWRAPQEQAAQHALLLAGQSNAAMIQTWQLRRAAGRPVVVRRSTRIGTSIRWWLAGDRAERLVRSVPARLPVRAVALLWVQGERDAGRLSGGEYAAALRLLVARVEAEADRRWPGVEVRVVLGRLSDYRADLGWLAIREAQMRVAAEDGHVWVDADDLNTGLHYWGRYAEWAERLVRAALAPEEDG